MSESTRVIITAVETVRLERVIEIPRERYAKYHEMVECGADQVEWTLVFGDLLRESPDAADSLGFEDLKITPAPRALLDAGVNPMAGHWEGLKDVVRNLRELVERNTRTVKSTHALIERSADAVNRSKALLEQTRHVRSSTLRVGCRPLTAMSGSLSPLVRWDLSSQFLFRPSNAQGDSEHDSEHALAAGTAQSAAPEGRTLQVSPHIRGSHPHPGNRGSL
jgi:hypothetical protein